jgi:hypothetical protein
VAPRVEVRGLRDFRRELRRLDDGRELRRGLTAIHRDIAKLVRRRTEAAAPPDVKQSLGHRATQAAAFLTMSPRPPRALGVFWGAKRRFGWYAASRYAQSSARQFEPWVGNQWDPGETGSFGSRPYYIGAAIDRSVDEIIDMLGDGLEDLARRAFPDGEHAN